VKKPVRNPISADDRETYRAFLLLWQEKLGLDDWRINLRDKKTPSALMADVECHHLARLANFRLGDSFGGTPVTAESLEATALHEMLHVLLHELVEQNTIGLEGDPLASAEHRVVHVLETLLLKVPK
jgi:hypothetical protein